MRSFHAIALATLLAAAPAFAQAPKPQQDQDHTAHHPDGKGAPPTAQGVPATGKPGGMGMMGGMSMMGSPEMGRMMSMMHGGGMMLGMPQKHLEGRIAFLKAELKITAPQEPLWTRFAEALRSTASTNTGMMAMMKPAQGTPAQGAPEMLGQYLQMLTQRAEAVRALKAALDPLYAGFSAEQRKAADELLTGPMMPM